MCLSSPPPAPWFWFLWSSEFLFAGCIYVKPMVRVTKCRSWYWCCRVAKTGFCCFSLPRIDSCCPPRFTTHQASARGLRAAPHPALSHLRSGGTGLRPPPSAVARDGAECRHVPAGRCPVAVWAGGRSARRCPAALRRRRSSSLSQCWRLACASVVSWVSCWVSRFLSCVSGDSGGRARRGCRARRFGRGRAARAPWGSPRAPGPVPSGHWSSNSHLYFSTHFTVGSFLCVSGLQEKAGTRFPVLPSREFSPCTGRPVDAPAL